MKVSKLRARTSMRHLAGADIPRADTTSFGMRNAMKKAKRASGGVCMGEVDGESKRAPLNKAVMRRNCGGKIGKADGGGSWGGEYDSGRPLKEKSAELRDEGKTASNVAKGLGAASLASFGGMLKSRSIPRALAAGYAAMGTGAATAAAAGRSMLKHNRADAADAEADKAEGRKSGGKVGKANGGPLDTEERNALSKKSFAGPDRSYPIPDANHARNALSRVSQFGSPAVKSRVRGAVARKFPGIGK